MVSEGSDNDTIFRIMVILGGRRDKNKIIGQKVVGGGDDFVGGFVVEPTKDDLLLNYLV